MPPLNNKQRHLTAPAETADKFTAYCNAFGLTRYKTLDNILKDFLKDKRIPGYQDKLQKQPA